MLIEQVSLHNSNFFLTLPYMTQHWPLLNDDDVYITSLRNEFHKYLEDQGVENAKSYRSQLLVARLQIHFEVDGNWK